MQKNNNSNLINAIASYAVVNEKTGRLNGKETAIAVSDGLGFDVQLIERNFVVDGEIVCRIDKIGALAGTVAKRPTIVGEKRENAERNAKARKQKELTPEERQKAVENNFFVKLHAAKVERERQESEIDNEINSIDIKHFTKSQLIEQLRAAKKAALQTATAF